MNRRYLPFRLLSGLVFLTLVLPVLVQEGMLVDGVFYAAISNNMANGFGSFWFPRFTAIVLDSVSLAAYQDLPPLSFGLQSLFFKVFGSGFFTERFYSLCAGGVAFYLIVVLWKRIGRINLNVQYMEWVALFLWVLAPLTYWSYQNNVIDNTTSIFILLTVISQFKYLEADENKPSHLFYAGVCMFLAILSNGLSGLFALPVFFLHWIIFRKKLFYLVVFDTIKMLAIPILFFALLFFYDPAKQFMHHYFKTQILPVEFNGEIIARYLEILRESAIEFFPQVLLVIAFLFFFSRRKIKWKESYYRNKKHMLFFLLVGIVGCIPQVFMINYHPYQMALAFPYYAIALAFFIAPGLKRFIVKIDINKGVFKSAKFIFLSLISIVIIVSAFLWRKPMTDQRAIADAHLIAKHVGDHGVIAVNKAVKEDLRLQAYLMRYHHISLDSYRKHEFILLGASALPPDDYTFVPIKLDDYRLFEKDGD